MKSWKKILGLALSAALLTSALAGCTPADTKTSGSPSPSGSATPATGEAPLVQTEDVVQKLVGIPADTTMLTVDGMAVTAEQYYYWLTTAIENVGYYFNGTEGIDWTMDMGGQTVEEFTLDSAKQTATFYRIIENMVDERNITLTDEEMAELRTEIADNITQSGEETYAKQLQGRCFSDAGFRHLVEVTTRYQKLQETLFAEGGEMASTPEKLAAMAEEENLLAAKHILISTVDDNRQPLPEEEKAAAKTKAEGILAQLQAVSGDEQLSLFDKLMDENSEDGRNADGTLAAADGYLFGAGEMVQPFEDGTKALEFGQISDLVESDFGYHIILRLKPDNGSLANVGTGATMEQLWQNKVTDGWLEAAKVEDGPELAKVDVAGFNEKLTDYRATLTPAPTETTAPTPTPSA